VHTGKHLSDACRIQNGLKQGGALLLLLFIFTFEYAIRMVQESHEVLELNYTHQLVCVSVNLLDRNIQVYIIKKNTHTYSVRH